MPAFATHSIFASIVRRVTLDDAARAADLYPAGYDWGAMGPDPLYYYHVPFQGASTALAKRMHEEPSMPLFAALCASASEIHNTAALAYVLGFCTHYALDRVSNAFLEAQTAKLSVFMPDWNPNTRRRMVESDIDGIMIAEYISPEPGNFKAYKALDPNAAECIVLSKVLSEAAKKVYRARLSPAAIYHSLGNMRRAMHLAHSSVPAKAKLERFEKFFGRHGFASSMLRPAKPLSADCANKDHLPWSSKGETRTESFCDLFDSAVPLAVSLQKAVVDNYCRNRPLDPRFFPTNFKGDPIN